MSCNCEPGKKRTYYSSVQLFSEQEILSHAQIAYGGSDTLQSLRVVKRTARGGISVSRRGGCIFVPLLGARGFRA